ncbi:DNA polymerase Y family protein [Anaerotignum sp.]|uniref:DNA polymerase Y family protein n=1 Tax=Anaerotignum sp. TaxID=2039241 RepID=UPI0027148DAF|nr:DNA polymerase IV [Anaerotignum sp.]
MRTIFHIDVNSAFLSWSAVQLLKEGSMLDLRTVPSAVAGDSESRRGIILAKSIPAKKYGIVTGEPKGFALQKCPELICVSPDFSLYTRNSEEMFRILSQYSDRIEPFSIDEAFLDYTGMEQLFGSPLEGAKRLKAHIKKELGFAVNIGISSNKLLAKMAGELEKPDKIITLYPNELEKKLWPLPVEEMFMVGRRTAPRLKKMGIRTVGELARYPVALLEKEFKSYGRMLNAYANGIDDTQVAYAEAVQEVKSIGNSTTIPYDVEEREEAYKILLSLAETVSMRLRGGKVSAREIGVVIKTTDFQVYSHQTKLLNAVDCTNAVYETAKKIFDEAWKKEPIRHLGIRAGHLCSDDCIQLSFLEEDWSKQKQADEAMDHLRRKYGRETVMRSTFIGGVEPAYGGGSLKINHLRKK